MRSKLAILLVVAGVALMVGGFFSAAPWGTSTVADSNPIFQGAPLVFVVGIVFVVSAAIVYEVLPDKRRR